MQYVVCCMLRVAHLLEQSPDTDLGKPRADEADRVISVRERELRRGGILPSYIVEDLRPLTSTFSESTLAKQSSAAL